MCEIDIFRCGGADHVWDIFIKEKVSFLDFSLENWRKKIHFYLAKIYGKIQKLSLKLLTIQTNESSILIIDND